MDLDDAFDVVADRSGGDRSAALDRLAAAVRDHWDLDTGIAAAWLLESGLDRTDVDDILGRLGH
jgi:hypothetical protein